MSNQTAAQPTPRTLVAQMIEFQYEVRSLRYRAQEYRANFQDVAVSFELMAARLERTIEQIRDQVKRRNEPETTP